MTLDDGNWEALSRTSYCTGPVPKTASVIRIILIDGNVDSISGKGVCDGDEERYSYSLVFWRWRIV